MCLSPPPEKTTKLTMAPSKGQHPIKSFSITAIRVLSRIYVQNLIRNIEKAPQN